MPIKEEDGAFWTTRRMHLRCDVFEYEMSYVQPDGYMRVRAPGFAEFKVKSMVEADALIMSGLRPEDVTTTWTELQGWPENPQQNQED